MPSRTVSVSVIIPAYNAERWVGRAIESVLSQTVRPAEILVVDDGSRDGTPQASQKYSEVRYFHQQNSGPSVARNRGIAEARSEWIAFLDADDEWLPHKTESQWRVLESHPDLKWCASAGQRVGDGEPSHDRLEKRSRREVPSDAVLPFFSALVERRMSIGTPGLMIHRSVFEQIGIFDPELSSGEDLDLWCRIAFKYPLIGYCFSTCWYYHQVNPNSAVRKDRVHRDLPVNSFCRNMRAVMDSDPGVADEFRPYARKKIMDSLLREAAGDCLMASDTVENVKQLFPLTVCEQALLKGLKLLPRSISLRIVRRLRGRISL